MRSPARVSIVVTNHDYAEYVTDAVDSALAQRGASVEVIVVDDGSTDESLAVLAPYRRRVRLIAQPNGGQAAAFNSGWADDSNPVDIAMIRSAFFVSMSDQPTLIASALPAFGGVTTFDRASTKNSPRRER